MNKQEQIILVSGATGQQGGAVARHLLDRGFTVRALTRDQTQSTARTLKELGAEVVEGNFDDRESLDQALEDAYGAFSVQNTWTEGPENEIRFGKAFADAALDAGVEHFVYSSVGAAERNTGIPHFESKWEIEEYLRSIDLPITILRPVFFMDNWAGSKDSITNGKLPQPLSPDTSLQQIAVDDIGAFVAIAFENSDEWLGEAVELAGDELTMTETVEVFGEYLDQDVKYVQVSWDDFEDQAGEEMAIMYRWFEDEGYRADIKSLRRKYPNLKSLKTFLSESNIL